MIYLGLRCCLSLALALAGSGPEQLAVAASDPAASDPEALRARIADIVRESGVPGAAVAVVDGSRVWTSGFGRAALEGRAMDQDTLFRVGSLSKAFISLAIMRLVEAGRLRLSDRVHDLVPEIEVTNPWERTHPLRVEHLLEHTSGFDEMRFNEIFDPDARQERSQERPLLEVLRVNPRSRVVRWPPGSGWAYSQPGYTLAGYIIEKVSGLPYERFLEQEVFRPLGIEGATWRLSAETRLRLATGYHKRRPAAPVMLLHRPAGHLMISAAGLGRLVELMLGRGLVGGRRFLTTASIERIERCDTRSNAAAPACYGLGNWGDVQAPIPMRGHGGFMPGYLGYVRYAPDRRFGFAALVNDSGSSALGRINKAITNHLLGSTRPPPPPTVPTPSLDLQRYVGAYRLISPGIEFLRFKSDVYAGFKVRQERGQLYLEEPGGARVTLIATAEDHFRFSKESGSSIRFSRNEQGRRLVVVHNQTFEEQSAFWAAARRWAMEVSLLLLFSTAMVPVLLALSRDRASSRLLVRPFVAALSLLGASIAFDVAHDAGLLGVANVPTVAVWILTWLFALAAHTGFQRALRSIETAPLVRFYALLSSAAAVWIALHLSRYGLIGLRTWRW